MDDSLKETLSAMMDDQADELAVRRLLSKAEHHELRGQWRRWQQVHDLMRDDPVVPEPVDVSAGVRASLFGESADRPSRPTVHHRMGKAVSWRWSAAAMVMVSLAVGFGMGSEWESEGIGVVASGPPAALEGPPAEGDVPEIALQGLDDKQWEHLSRYLLEHAQHNSVGAGRGSIGYARLASVSGAVR
ncbi:sigma-E factor negative regulatory protein [Marinobacter changyiensis]|uniref:sigma-E factor negative regulatory protein n=1 Tax=Marinobacter changyiensis TaxID=2604091 RepID=UPI00126556D1|nr:sigma-E factor negative regulatory protein [Marinobacter changyiensis]